MKTDLKLQAVAQAFETWRKTRKNKSSKIPAQLASAVKKLGKHHKRSHIARAIKTSGSRINEILGSNDVQEIDFFEVKKPTTRVAVPSSSSTITCALERPDGITLKLTIPVQELSFVMETLLCCK